MPMIVTMADGLLALVTAELDGALSPLNPESYCFGVCSSQFTWLEKRVLSEMTAVGLSSRVSHFETRGKVWRLMLAIFPLTSPQQVFRPDHMSTQPSKPSSSWSPELKHGSWT